MIELFHVGKRFPGGQVALDDLTLRIEQGELVFLTGPSGAGKTTFLKLIYREEVPSSGNILVNGRNVSSLPRSKIPYLRRTIGVVFQNFRLIPRKTVFENVSYLPRILGQDYRSQRRLAQETLTKVGLGHRLSAFPLELSGGEQQRVAIARAIINRPEILLADEPTGNLDPELSEEILRLLLEIHRAGTTVILATHDRSLIQRVGHRVLTLSQGRLAADERLPPGNAEAELDSIRPGVAEESVDLEETVERPVEEPAGEPSVAVQGDDMTETAAELSKDAAAALSMEEEATTADEELVSGKEAAAS